MNITLELRRKALQSRIVCMRLIYRLGWSTYRQLASYVKKADDEGFNIAQVRYSLASMGMDEEEIEIFIGRYNALMLLAEFAEAMSYCSNREH